jgi:nucleoside-diphosphate-sugar epimerase
MNGLTLVTGASGFIGRYLIHRLLHEGGPVRVLVRDPARLESGLAPRLEVLQGDLCDGDSIGAAVRGARNVLHLAACARAWSRDPDEFRDVNIRATASLLETAQRAGVERLVHVSTILALPAFRPALIRGRAQRLTPYEESKIAGDRLAEEYAHDGLEVVIVHPTRVYGPGPLTDANAVTRVVAMYIAGRFRVRVADGDVEANYVHADDVALGIIRAAKHGRRGAHYVLGGRENLSFADFLNLVGHIAGRRRRCFAAPAGVALAIARAAETWARLGGSTSITPGWMRVFLEDRRADISSSRRELGYRPRSLRSGLSETIRWLRANGR